ncbi:cilia- and flagella-associated protein 161 isoform X1 [Hydra vulgaris]|uniref:cilia- and flagella-associated protein 161 isoform X1 n=1 Tax=Hydra vulgaris TaxID=6087 RepID=UPI001F5F9F17|nr:cilia- and flagella-associated protein 161 isoform X1 [Hydra vulgaris]XP_047139783.1 cilia- and flagella-associated protein 161 isoform X1 [Hydra vulgaris]XP_047139784.1 cilia- and flagella-associated protein 161 isoform X1 [Hydra vulgaris]
MSVGKYNPSVRVGNWNEDLCLEEEMLKDFLDKRENGELLAFKRKNLFLKLLQHVKLTQNDDEKVRFGDVICLHNVFIKENLSISMSESQLQDSDIVNCSVSVSPILQPCFRNAFVVTSYDRVNKTGDLLCYGQSFVLSALPNQLPNIENLKLTSNPVTFMKHSKKFPYQEVSMASTSTYLNNWQVLHHDPQMRLETEGFPIKVNEKIVIKHCYTNRALAAVSDYTTRTAFGREHEVAAHTFLDSHKAEKPENHWVIVAYRD